MSEIHTRLDDHPALSRFGDADHHAKVDVMETSISRGFCFQLKQWGHQGALSSILVLTALFGWDTSARADDGARGVVRVMTQNLYEGTNFSELVSATTPLEFLAAVTTTRQNILATKPAVRAAAVAREIARERPDLVAIQEAAILRSEFVPVTSPATPVTTVEVDQLALLLGDLERLGHPYHAVAILPNLDAQAPSSLGSSVRITVRGAILARTVRDSDNIRVSNLQVQEFLDASSLTTPVGIAIPNQRGWASVDVSVGGREFRFITTHLDQSPSFNLLQAREALKSAVHSTPLPVVFVGDFNVLANVPSHPSYATYLALLNDGLVDAWQQKHAPDPGVNCCQSPDVMNVVSSFTYRIDLVLLRGGIDIRDIHIVGNDASQRAVDGVWPSDHAGVVATLRIP